MFFFNPYVYDAFGNLLTTPPAQPNQILYGGRFGYYTDATGLDYVRARYYDPVNGRWVNRDPIGFTALDWNLYRHVGNSPISRNDPSGLGPNLSGTCKQSICGPDIKAPLEQALNSMAREFAKLSWWGKRYACSAWSDPTNGLNTWDIVQLHMPSTWLPGYQSPQCETWPDCSITVQVDNQCFYPGSVNYVMFGEMFRLCCPKYMTVWPFESCAQYMTWFITIYKSRYENYQASVDWALAGFRGWPAGSNTPPGDRPNCAPVCTTPYHSGPFKVHWLGVGDFT